MMQEHINAMRQAAQAQGQERARTRMGTVSGYDASNYLAKVILQPDGTETGWIPIGCIAVGNGWGIQMGPAIGDMVQVQFQEGDVDSPLITAFYFNDGARPNAVPSGEFWLVHKSGSFIKLLSDGSISSKGTWNHQGDLNVTGNETVTGGITAQGTVMAPNVVGTTNVTFGGKSGVGHTHSGVLIGGASTGAPN